MRLTRIAVLSIALVLAIFAYVFVATQPVSAGPNNGVQMVPKPTVQHANIQHAVPLGVWQPAEGGSSHQCQVWYMLGNLSGGGFGRLLANGNCVSAGASITVYVPPAPPLGGFLFNAPTTQTCTWSVSNGTVGGCALLQPSTDLWLQRTGSSIVSITVWGCYGGGCTSTVADPFPG